jgi:hypothetical protein
MTEIPDARNYTLRGDSWGYDEPSREIEPFDPSLADGGDGTLGSLFAAPAQVAQLEANGGCIARWTAEGKIEELSLHRGASGFSITTITYNSVEDYDRKQRLIAMIKDN